MNETLKSKLKSLRPDDAHGKLHPIRSRYASSFSSGAREMAVNATSWFWRWRCVSSKPSATPEQLGQPSSQSGPYMKWYTSSCERPWNRSASVASPSSVSKTVVLVDAHPRQLAPLPGEVVVEAGQLLLGLEQLEPRIEPLVAGTGAVIRHRASPSLTQ